MLIREASEADWAGIWPVLHEILAAGETFCLDVDTTEQQARALWLHQPPGRTFVALDDGVVLGTAELHPNHGGGGGHVANAGFMVAPTASGRGVGRALGEYVLEVARADGYLAMQFNAVVETNAGAVSLWRAMGFDILATVPDAFRHPSHGLVGLHIMHRRL